LTKGDRLTNRSNVISRVLTFWPPPEIK